MCQLSLLHFGNFYCLITVHVYIKCLLCYKIFSWKLDVVLSKPSPDRVEHQIGCVINGKMQYRLVCISTGHNMVSCLYLKTISFLLLIQTRDHKKFWANHRSDLNHIEIYYTNIWRARGSSKDPILPNIDYISLKILQLVWHLEELFKYV